jgi:hypothetical protein
MQMLWATAHNGQEEYEVIGIVERANLITTEQCG